MEMFPLKLSMVKGQCSFNLDYAGAAAKKELNLEICESTLYSVISFLFF